MLFSLIDVVINLERMFHWQVYPNERHSLRHLDASEHYETVMLTFLRNSL